MPTVRRFFLVGFGIILLIFFSPDLNKLGSVFLLSLIAFSVSILLMLFSSFSLVERSNQKLTIKNLNKKIEIDNLCDFETWWSYNFGTCTKKVGNDDHGKMRSDFNKIHCFVKFRSEEGEMFIYQQIHMGSKFPIKYEYLPNKQIDKSKTVKVSDIGQCLKKLDLA